MTAARVLLFGTHVGSVSWDPERQLALFEYTPEFLTSGIQIAPLTMPLRRGVFSFADLSRESFRGLPGLLADCLPDRFGNLLINRWLAEQGRTPDSFNPVERLCYLGSRAMGALEFEPALMEERSGGQLELDRLVELANRALSARNELHADFSEEGLSEIIRVGTSAGGARAKAVIAWNPTTGEVRSGQVAEHGFESWLLKFDGVEGNRDKESTDPMGYGRIEYAYHLMARDAGLTMSECRLLEEGGRAHFLTRRFDRDNEGAKDHMQTLCGIAHLDFNEAGAHSYEQAFQVARRLALSQPEQAELYRRAVFNIIARNQDDHTKNISFLMNRQGIWRLAPAYDVTYSYNPEGAWTGQHQMSLGGRRDEFARDDLLEAASAANVKPKQARMILQEVVEAVRRWPEFAREARVAERTSAKIARVHRLDRMGEYKGARHVKPRSQRGCLGHPGIR